MFREANAKSIPPEESYSDYSNSDSQTNEKVKKENVKYETPPELQRNEAAARMRTKNPPPTTDKASGSDESRIDEDEDDPCSEKKRRERAEEKEKKHEKFRRTPGPDPRFQQQNQTLRCYVMYTDFYRCEKILGNGNEACTWFRDVFTSICPNAWISRWDELRESGRLPWSEEKTQGKFPGDRYGAR